MLISALVVSGNVEITKGMAEKFQACSVLDAFHNSLESGALVDQEIHVILQTWCDQRRKKWPEGMRGFKEYPRWVIQGSLKPKAQRQKKPRPTVPDKGSPGRCIAGSPVKDSEEQSILYLGANNVESHLTYRQP